MIARIVHRVVRRKHDAGSNARASRSAREKSRWPKEVELPRRSSVGSGELRAKSSSIWGRGSLDRRRARAELVGPLPLAEEGCAISLGACCTSSVCPGLGRVGAGDASWFPPGGPFDIAGSRPTSRAVMLPLPRRYQVIAYARPADMRKGFDTLSTLIPDLLTYPSSKKSG